MIKLVAFLLISVCFMQIANAQEHKEDSANPTANEYMHQNSHEELAKAFDSSERDKWQKPEEVIAFLGNIENKTIIDLGSGSGYFTFRLVGAGANVIATDVDNEFLKIIEEKQKQLDIDHDKLKTMLISENELSIGTNMVDLVFMVNVYHHLSNRVSYFNAVNNILRQNGKIVIVDFYKETLPVGPSKNHKISKDEVLKELDEAGFKNIDVNTELLEYQYIITAYKF